MHAYFQLFALIFISWISLMPRAYAQSDAPPGFRFQFDERDVTAITYWGNAGLRSGKLHELPKLDHVTIASGTTLTKDDVSYLSSLTKISGLTIGQQLVDSPVSIDGGVSELAKLTSLESVHFCKHDIEDSDLEFVASLPKLTHLEFNADSDLNGGGSTLSDQCADYITRAKTIESVYIQGYGKLTDRFVSKLTSSLPRLEHLNLHCPSLTDESLRYLATRSKNLIWLDVGSNKITDLGIEHLSAAKNMQMLWVRSEALTAKCVQSVSGLDRLEHLELTVSTIDDDGVRVLANLRRLKNLALREPAITDSQLALFRNHPALRSVFLNGSKLSQENVVKVINEIPHLEHLSVGSVSGDLQSVVHRELSLKSASR